MLRFLLMSMLLILDVYSIEAEPRLLYECVDNDYPELINVNGLKESNVSSFEESNNETCYEIERDIDE